MATTGSMAMFVEGHSTTRPPLFSGVHFLEWKRRMKLFLKANNVELWYIVNEGDYEAKIRDDETGQWRDKTRRELDENDKKNLVLNAKAAIILLNALDENEAKRVKGLEQAKDIWDKLNQIHEGSDSMKEEKKSLLVAQYEKFKMEPDEKIDHMYCRFNNLVKDMEALGKEYPIGELNRKILHALPEEWEPKCIAIEESKNLRELPIEQLISSLTSYELKMKAKFYEEEEVKEKKNLALKAANQSKMEVVNSRGKKSNGNSRSLTITLKTEESSDKEEWENHMCFMAKNDEVTNSSNSFDI